MLGLSFLCLSVFASFLITAAWNYSHGTNLKFDLFPLLLSFCYKCNAILIYFLKLKEIFLFLSL